MTEQLFDYRRHRAWGWREALVTAAENRAIVELAARGNSRITGACVVICGLARDLGELVDSTIARIEAMGRIFNDYRVVIVENDSSDSTSSRLHQWAQRNRRVTVLSMRLGARRFGSTRERERTDQLASFREIYRSFVVQHYRRTPYVIVLDTDIGGGWCLHGLKTSFGHSGWGAIASNGILFVPVRVESRVVAYRQIYYDSWAFRLMSRLQPMRNTPVNRLNFSPSASLLPVLSAFGGLAVYTMDAFCRSYYSGEDCEHVPFHLRMQSQGFRVFVNPNQLVLYNKPAKGHILVVGEPLLASAAAPGLERLCAD